jgi:hypothetical protein
MKRQYIALSFSLMLFMALVSSCARLNKNTTTLPSETPSLPVSSATPIPSFTPLPIDSPTPTFTPTAIPTLPVEEAQAKLLKLLSDNGGCRLPCIWGVVLGESPYHDAQAALLPLSSISELTSFTPESGAIFPVYTEGELQIYTNIGFLANSENKIVNHIAFNAEVHRPLAQGGYEEVFNSKFFGEKVSAYALSHVLTEQGIPSSVMIETAGGPLTRGGTGGFDILLLYPDQGILVNYRTQMHLNGANVRGCPANAYIQMELYPPGQPDSFSEGLKQTDWPLKMTGYKPLEEVASMSVQEFYDTFREPTDKCIETSIKLWPTPEP